MSPPSHLFEEPSYIRSIPHLPAVETCILGLALRFTLLGRIDAVRDFIELLYSRSNIQNHEFAGLRALVPYWHKTHFPAGIPEKMKTDAYLNDYMSSKNQGLEWPYYVQKDQRTEDEHGITAIMSPDHDRYGRTISPARTVALDLAIRLAKKQRVEPSSEAKVLEILTAIAEHFPDRWEYAHIVDSPNRVSVFMSGALAEIWNLSSQQLDARAVELLEASRQRYWHISDSQGPKTISELLKSCNDDTVTKSDDEVAEKPTSLYKPPATEQDILDLEQRLGINLPDDFKEFLRISNGFEAIWNGYFPESPLRSTEEIDWLDYSEYELCSDQLGLPWLEDFRTTVDKVPDPPIFTTVICISSEDIYDVWLIPPPLMRQMRDHNKLVYSLVNEEGKRIIERAVDDFAGSWQEWENLEWGCCSWACGGSAQLDSFKSFKAWLETAAWDAKNA